MDVAVVLKEVFVRHIGQLSKEMHHLDASCCNMLFRGDIFDVTCTGVVVGDGRSAFFSLAIRASVLSSQLWSQSFCK